MLQEHDQGFPDIPIGVAISIDLGHFPMTVTVVAADRIQCVIGDGECARREEWRVVFLAVRADLLLAVRRGSELTRGFLLYDLSKRVVIAQVEGVASPITVAMLPSPVNAPTAQGFALGTSSDIERET